MAGSPEAQGTRLKAGLVAAVAAAGLLWFFPPFRVVPLKAAADPVTAAAAPVAFDAAATAARLWSGDLAAASGRAVELPALVAALRQDPAAARQRFAKASGLGAAYYFVRGSGRVVGRERNYLQVAVDGADGVVVALRIGPVFGNTVRDGCGLLDVNSFPGLEEFNALSAELNGLVERSVLPGLKAGAKEGAIVSFAGCAEAPEGLPAEGGPFLTIVPVKAEVR